MSLKTQPAPPNESSRVSRTAEQMLKEAEDARLLGNLSLTIGIAVFAIIGAYVALVHKKAESVPTEGPPSPHTRHLSEGEGVGLLQGDLSQFRQELLEQINNLQQPAIPIENSILAYIEGMLNLEEINQSDINGLYNEASSLLNVLKELPQYPNSSYSSTQVADLEQAIAKLVSTPPSATPSREMHIRIAELKEVVTTIGNSKSFDSEKTLASASPN